MIQWPIHYVFPTITEIFSFLFRDFWSWKFLMRNIWAHIEITDIWFQILLSCWTLRYCWALFWNSREVMWDFWNSFLDRKCEKQETWAKVNPGSLKILACDNISSTLPLHSVPYCMFLGSFKVKHPVNGAKTHIQYMSVATFLLRWYRYVLRQFRLQMSIECR